jgi:hypothetical protein
LSTKRVVIGNKAVSLAEMLRSQSSKLSALREHDPHGEEVANALVGRRRSNAGIG